MATPSKFQSRVTAQIKVQGKAPSRGFLLGVTPSSEDSRLGGSPPLMPECPGRAGVGVVHICRWPNLRAPLLSFALGAYAGNGPLLAPPCWGLPHCRSGTAPEVHLDHPAGPLLPIFRGSIPLFQSLKVRTLQCVSHRPEVRSLCCNLASGQAASLNSFVDFDAPSGAHPLADPDENSHTPASLPQLRFGIIRVSLGQTVR